MLDRGLSSGAANNQSLGTPLHSDLTCNLYDGHTIMDTIVV